MAGRNRGAHPGGGSRRPDDVRPDRHYARIERHPFGSSIHRRRNITGAEEAETRLDMKLTHRFAQLAPEKRPQDPHMNGTGLRFETMEHGGEYPDTMPQAIKVT